MITGRNENGFFVNGHKHSEETKRKLKKVRHTKEWNKKVSLANMGKKVSKEARKNMSLSHIGKKISEKTKRKMSFAAKGRKPSLKNINITKKRMCGNKLFLERHHTEETRLKISKMNIGKKHPGWKGGVSPIRLRIHNSFRYQQWRQDIFVRDNFTCQACKVRGGILHAHHKNKTFSQLLQEIRDNLPLFSLYDGTMIYAPLWDINNGITLCKECHGKKHKKKIIK